MTGLHIYGFWGSTRRFHGVNLQFDMILFSMRLYNIFILETFNVWVGWLVISWTLLPMKCLDLLLGVWLINQSFNLGWINHLIYLTKCTFSLYSLLIPIWWFSLPYVSKCCLRSTCLYHFFKIDNKSPALIHVLNIWIGCIIRYQFRLYFSGWVMIISQDIFIPLRLCLD